MTPPPRIQNFLTGSGYHQARAASVEDPVLPRTSRVPAGQGDEARSRETLASARASYLFVQGNRYGREAVLPLFQQLPTPGLEEGLEEWIRQARRGDRRMYFNSLRLAYATLARGPAERRGHAARRILGLSEEYINFLDHSPLSPLEKFRYLFAASRVFQATLAFVHDQPIARGGENLEGLLAQGLRQIDLRLREYYADYQAHPSPAPPGLSALYYYSRLRESGLRGDNPGERNWALRLASILTETPPDPRDPNWVSFHLESILREENFLDRLAEVSQPSPAERETVALNGLALDLTLAAAWSLDRFQEEEEAALRERYSALSTMTIALLQLEPQWTLGEILEQLADPRARNDNLQSIRRALRQFPTLGEALSPLGGPGNLEQILRRAQEAARHVMELGRGAGQAVLAPLLRLSRRHHPIGRLAEVLENPPPWTRELNLPSPGLPFYSARAAQAVELYRQGPVAREYLENLQTSPADRVTPQVLRMLRAQGTRASLRGFLEELLQTAQGILEDGEDHELGALHALLQTLEENVSLYTQIGVDPRGLRQAGQMRARMEGWEFRGRQTLRHLFSGSNLLGIGGGILMTELFPSLLILRAGPSGRFSLPLLGNVVRGGSLTPTGAALTGITTGLAMSGVGSLLNHAHRRQQGLASNPFRDFAQGALLNSLVFGLTLPFSRALGNRLAMRNWQRHGVYEISGWNRIFHHAATVGVAGTSTLGLGILLRGARTGELSITPEEVAENLGSILLWETGTAGLGWARRHWGISKEMAGFPQAPTRAPIPGVIGTRGWARLAELGNRARRGFQRETLSTLGPYRMAWARDLSRRLPEANPGLRGSEPDLFEALVLQESRTAESLAHFEMQMRLGNRPAWLGRGRDGRVVMVRGDRLPRESEVPARRVLNPSGEGQSGAEVITASSDFHFAVSEPGGESGTLRLPRPEIGPNGERIYTLGREHFDFLSPEVRRIVSRRQFQLIRDERGNWRWRDLSRGPSADPTPLRAGEAISLGLPGEGITLTFLSSSEGTSGSPTRSPAVYLGDTIPPQTRLGGLRPPEPLPFNHPSSRPPPQLAPAARIALDLGGRHPLGHVMLVRDRDGSVFRLVGNGGTHFTITRQRGETAGKPFRVAASENPIVGEIGETVDLIVERADQTRAYRIFLDDPAGNGSRLPQATLQYGGGIRTEAFRSTSPILNMGRFHSEGFFSGSWISRQHVILELVERFGHPRYRLTTQGRNGLRVNGEMLQQGDSLDLAVGDHTLEFPLRQEADAFDSPLRLKLSPIEVNFPDWRLNLVSGHDRGVFPIRPEPIEGPPDY